MTADNMDDTGGAPESEAEYAAANDPLYPLALRAAATENLRDRLRNGEVWTDANGRTHKITRMDRRHAANVIRFIERHADRLHDGACWDTIFWPIPRGDAASDAVDDAISQLYEVTPLEWLNEQPLVIALRERAGDTRPGPSKRWLASHPVLAVKMVAHRARVVR